MKKYNSLKVVCELLNDSDDISAHSKSSNNVATSSRFALVNDLDVESARDSSMPSNTKKMSKQALSIWKDWALSRNESTQFSINAAYNVAPMNIGTTELKEMNYWFERFSLEVRDKNKEYYQPSTLYRVFVTDTMSIF